ncbi:hypothetical protein GCM10023148_17070 [Actinokineospora soli]
MSTTTRCSSWNTTDTSNGTGTSTGSSRWNHTDPPRTNGASTPNGPDSDHTPPEANNASTRSADTGNRSTRWSRTVAHASDTGNRTRTASTPARWGRGDRTFRRIYSSTNSDNTRYVRFDAAAARRCDPVASM